MKLSTINEDQALIIQIIEEHGEEDIDNLAETLRFDHRRLINLLQSLQHKGLVKLRTTGYGTMASLSRKGRKTAQLIWPEIPYVHYG